MFPLDEALNTALKAGHGLFNRPGLIDTRRIKFLPDYIKYFLQVNAVVRPNDIRYLISE